VIEFSVDPYFKLPLDAPRRYKGELDYRMDIYAAMEWKLGKLLPTSKTETSLVFQYENHSDNIPPNLTAFGHLLTGGEFNPERAEKSHNIFKLNVKIRW
jgi:hypothetical protein